MLLCPGGVGLLRESELNPHLDPVNHPALVRANVPGVVIVVLYRITGASGGCSCYLILGSRIKTTTNGIRLVGKVLVLSVISFPPIGVYLTSLLVFLPLSAYAFRIF